LNAQLTSGHLAIVGGGLSGLLTAWRVAELNPNVRITVYEAKSEVAGDHTWSFNDTDVSSELYEWLTPFIRYNWPRYDVRFPKRKRTLEIGYCSGDSQSLCAAIVDLRKSGRIEVHTNRRVELSDIDADAVLDARGYQPREDEYPGWQKFVGHTIRTKIPHGINHPVIMDATVEQVDGYRFVYLLPFSETDLLVEDTYFSDTPNLSTNEIGGRIADYIAEKGWSDHEVIRTEQGVLPMMMATDRNDDSAQIGLRGGFAVAATGFTVPHAVELADHIAKTIAKTGVNAAPKAVADFRRMHLRRERYARLLNRMFFRAADPAKRYCVLQRFYGFKPALIRRFYRNGLSPAQKLRIVIGKPPVPVTKALYNFSEKAFIARERKRNESP